MRVPVELSEAFGKDFQARIAGFVRREGLLPSSEGPEALESTRFLNRAVVPHVRNLSRLFNRMDGDEAETTVSENYWSKASSNPRNLRLAYFIYFMPSNLYRMAAVWAELARLGYRWPFGEPLRGLDLGSGPAAAAAGVAAGERFASIGLPRTGNWALIEKDKRMLKTGARWLGEFGEFIGGPDWDVRTFARALEPAAGFLPPGAPKFHLWTTSYFLNELDVPAGELARALTDAWNKHLEDEGLVILIEPALKVESRRLLELRAALLAEWERGDAPYRVLLPCLGHQACGALAKEDDWCHEEVTWWRPPYYRTIDRLARLDRKTLPFSYLVLTKSRRPLEEILPELGAPAGAGDRYRLVSPARREGRDTEFYICGQSGKHRARQREAELDFGRGDILLGAELEEKGSRQLVQRLRKRV